MWNNAKYTFVSPSFLGDRPIATEARLATFFSLLIELGYFILGIPELFKRIKFAI